MRLLCRPAGVENKAATPRHATRCCAERVPSDVNVLAAAHYEHDRNQLRCAARLPPEPSHQRGKKRFLSVLSGSRLGRKTLRVAGETETERTSRSAEPPSSRHCSAVALRTVLCSAERGVARGGSVRRSPGRSSPLFPTRRYGEREREGGGYVYPDSSKGDDKCKMQQMCFIIMFTPVARPWR